MEIVVVPFLKKAGALELGAVFNRTDRKWYVPDNLPEENKEKLRSLAKDPVETSPLPKEQTPDNDTSGLTYIQKQYYEEPEKRTTSQTVQKLPELSCTLEAALFICRNGLPEDTGDRVRLLKILSNRSASQYPVTYDGMVVCSESFASKYPPELLSELCKRCITGARHYAEEINASDLNEEEKALLFFALPV